MIPLQICHIFLWDSWINQTKSWIRCFWERSQFSRIKLPLIKSPSLICHWAQTAKSECLIKKINNKTRHCENLWQPPTTLGLMLVFYYVLSRLPSHQWIQKTKNISKQQPGLFDSSNIRRGFSPSGQTWWDPLVWRCAPTIKPRP